MSHDAMKCFVILLACACATAAEDEGHQTTTTTKIPKVQVTRTALHVARSLDPDSTETVNVRTRTGDIATLIVRKRGGKSNLALPLPVSVRSSSINILNEEEREGKSGDVASLNVPAPVTVSSAGFLIEDEDNQRIGKSSEDVINIVAPPKDLRPPSSSLELLVKQYNDENNREKKTMNVPPPVYVRSSPMSIKGEQERTDDFWKRGRSVMHVDSDGIPVIHGVRMPDDESDRQTWRNARVINGFLVPYDKSSNTVDAGDTQEITRKATVHLEDSTTKKKTAEDSSPFQPVSYLERIVKKKPQYNYPYASDTHERILEYINTVNQRESDRRSNVQSRARMIRFPASRRSDEAPDETGTVAFGRSSSDPESQARLLHYPGSAIYPTSLLYTPPSAKTSRVSFEEGVRTPVLQYAHPELGVQPAKVMRKQDEVEELDESQQETKRGEGGKANALTLALFSQDIHSDRSPYAYEPGMEANEERTEAATTDASVYDKRSNSGEEDFSDSSTQWPRKPLAYLHEQQPADDSYGLGNDKYIKRYPYTGYSTVHSGPSEESLNRYKGTPGGPGYSRYPFGNGHYMIHTVQERPFWERLGDTIREHVQTSMEKMSDLTRPVVEPLVEATHKISHNLGFAGEGNRHVIQDKVGSTVAAYPVLLPALGLVAGGAALGLGAAAVGRYLDVDVMKRRIDSDELQVEHKRALESIMNNLGERESVRQEGTWVVAEEFKNPEEQKKVIESSVRALNERQGGGQDDAQRKAVEEIVRSVREKHNGRQGQWMVADDSVKQDEVKMIEKVIRTLKATPREDAREGTWVLLRNVNPSSSEKVQLTVGRQGAWSRADDIGNQNEKQTIESIVGTLAEQEGIGHRQGSWIVTEESSEENEQRKGGGWAVKKDNITPNERQTKTKRSLNDEVIFVVEEDPESQSRRQISMQGMEVGSNTHFRRERDLNREIIAKIGKELVEGPLSSFGVVEGEESRYEHSLVKRSAHEATNSDEVTIQQLPLHSHHVISKRSTTDSHNSNDKVDDAVKLEDGEQYLNNILHSLESSQQEILATMARLDDHHRGDWSNTPCAKKIFCDVMVKQSADAVMLMEKKMATFLSLIQPNEAVSYHLSDVMDAVKRHDCSEFTCPSAVDPSRVDTPTHGPGPR